jgi:hypothetical protein
MELIDERYLEFIRGQPCSVPKCWMSSSFAHHVLSRGAGRNDYLTVPLCASHHNQGGDSVHMLGIETFQKLHEIDFQEIIFCLMKRYVRIPG